MSNKVNGLWAVNSSSVFMFFDSVNTPSVWRFEMKDGVELWRMIPGVKNAQAVRGVQMVCCDYLLAHQSQPPPMNCQQSESASISMICKSGNFSRVSLFTRVSACSRVV